MKKLLPLLLFFISGTVFGQFDPTELNWCFGYSAGVSFTSGSPVAFTSAISSAEGSASISNSAGNLILQAQGFAVYSGANNLLPNGGGLMGSTIAAQSNLFIPDPGNPNLYYLFTVNNWTDSNPALRYSVIDMTLNGGTGGVVTGMKNILLGADTREQLTATRHSNGIDWWIVSHRFGNSEFTAYLLTATGISTTPVVSAVGMIYASGNRYGSLRFSNGCQKKLASALGGGSSVLERVQLFDFNNATGVVSNPITVATSATLLDAYSVEFSPDDSKLYVTAYNSPSIRQYDLNSPNIAASMIPIGASFPGVKSWVEQGPDGKIYVSRPGTSFLGRINEPNLAGALCDYEHSAVNLGSGSCGLALPNFPDNSTNAVLSVNAGAQVSICSGATAQLQPQGQQAGFTYTWSPATGLSSVTAFSPTVTLTNTTSSPVTATYTLTASNGLCTGTDVVSVTVNPAPAVNAGAALTICSGATAQLQPQGQLPGTTYLWSPATGLSNPTSFSPTVTLTNSTNLPVSQTYTLTATSNGCTSTDNVTVTINPSPAVEAGAALSFCSGGSTQLQPQGQQPGTTYVWSPATGLSSTTAFSPTVTLTNSTGLPVSFTYTLTATSNGCSSSDNVTVTVNPGPAVEAGAALSFCSGGSTQLQPQGQLPGTTYVWSPATGLSSATAFSPTVTLTNTTNLPVSQTYTLTATSNGCTSSDNVTVTVNPLPTVDAGAALSICSGASIVLQPQGQQPGYTYSWSPTTGLTNPTLFDPIVTLTNTTSSPNTVTYTLTATSNGCSSSDVVAVTVNPAPTVEAGAAIGLCSGASTQLQPQGQLPGATYVWSPATGLSSATAFSPTVTLTNSTSLPVSQTYTLTATSNGCSASDVVQVTVNPTPAGVLTGVVSLCPPRYPGDLNEVGYLFLGAGGATAGNWGVNGGGNIVQQIGTDSITVQWGPSNSNASVWVIPTNSSGCPGDTITLPVLVRPAIQTALPTGPTSLCANALTNQTYNAVLLPGHTYHWIISGGQIVAGDNTHQIQVNWQQPGPGMLIVNQQNHTSSDTCTLYSDTLFVNFLPAPAPIAAVAGNTVVCAGNSATYSVTGLPTASYQWQAQGGQITSGQGTGSIQVMWSTIGNHTLTVQETGTNGCLSLPYTLAVQVQGTTPNVLIAPPGFCTGGSDGLTYAVQSVPGSNYQWQLSGGDIQTGQGTNQVTINWDSTATAFSLSVTETSGSGCVSAAVTIPVVFDNSKLQLVRVTVDTTDESQVLVYYMLADSLNNPQQVVEVQRKQSSGNYVTTGNSAVSTIVFTDAGLQTGQQAYYYRLQGQNLCADELRSNEHATVWLKGLAQDNSVQLQWTAYEGWGNQEIQYQVWRKLENENEYHLLPNLTTTQTSIQAQLGQDGLNQCFRIMAIAADTRQSWSNSICMRFVVPIVVPNIVTPNADGKNDVFMIDHMNLYPNSELVIFNRWGKEVYRNSNYQNTWGAENLADGVYFYQLNVPNKPGLKGWIEVIK